MYLLNAILELFLRLGALYLVSWTFLSIVHTNPPTYDMYGNEIEK